MRSLLPYLIKDIRHTGSVENTFFVIALDNDRSPKHPTHERPSKTVRLSRADLQKSCRFCELLKAVEDILGDRQSWPIPGAIAVPVEMLESWLLLICDPQRYGDEAALPSFAHRTQADAQRYYGGPKKTPDQLKDLSRLEKDGRGMPSNLEFCAYCARELDPDDLAHRSTSFALFKAQVDAWPSRQA